MSDIAKFYKDFGISPINDKKALNNQQLHNLYKTPIKDKGPNMPTFQVLKPNTVHQADLLFLPNDEGYKYLLVVVDGFNKKIDAEPLKHKKAQDVKTAFEKIYNRNILDLPKRMEVDDGKEFKGIVKTYFENNDVFVRVAKPQRHRQQALVERKNQDIGESLFKKMTAEELLTGDINREWVKQMPIVIDSINTQAKKIKDNAEFAHCKDDSCNLLERGQRVRVILEAPRDITGNKLHGKFRKSDTRWNPTVREIKEVLLKPGFPPLYLLNGHVGDHEVEPIGYTKNQLQIIPENEQLPLTEAHKRKDPLIGKYIEVYWEDYDKWYRGTVTSIDPKNKNNFVVYYDQPDTKNNHHIFEMLKGKNKVTWRLVK